MPTDHVRRQIEELQTRYVRVIDDDRVEEWPKLFTPTCLYRIVTRENHSQGLPLSIMECRSRGMMEDRVTGLRRVNVYEPQRYTHQIGALEIEAESETRFKCRSNYLVVRTTSDGSMTVFSTGVYLDTVVVDGETTLFEERIVVQESRRVDTLVVIPL
jgi:anthranilate 1,2-dioxygenase small subunit